MKQLTILQSKFVILSKAKDRNIQTPCDSSATPQNDGITMAELEAMLA